MESKDTMNNKLTGLDGRAPGYDLLLGKEIMALIQVEKTKSVKIETVKLETRY